MIENLEIQSQPRCRRNDDYETRPTLKFNKSDGFQVELRRRVDAFFESTGRRPRDCWQMYLKTAILLTVYAATYVLLVFFAQTAWQALPLAVLLGLATAGIGFNVQHDAGHHAYSSRPWVNKLMAMTLDCLGGSSYIWHWKHGIFHHTYANVTGYDADIEIGIFGRLSPHQPWRSFYRWQHIYLWPLYGLLAIQWHLHSDFYEVLVGRIGRNRFPRPKGWDLAIFVGGKAVFFTLAFAAPLLFHPLWIVIAYYMVAAVTVGITLSTVFQLAHVVEHADFPLPAAGTHQMENAWAVHQVETTVDFARHSPIAAWLLGGLNFQVEHHLFPHLPRPLPRDLQRRGSHMPRIRHPLCRAPNILVGCRGAFLLAAKNGIEATDDLGNRKSNGLLTNSTTDSSHRGYRGLRRAPKDIVTNPTQMRGIYAALACASRSFPIASRLDTSSVA